MLLNISKTSSLFKAFSLSVSACAVRLYARYMLRDVAAQKRDGSLRINKPQLYTISERITHKYMRR